ncbi:hypothetical protein PRIPAC_92411, partial [Pristionchus pacificus]
PEMNRNVSHRKAYNKSIVFHAFHGQDITLNQDLCRAVNTHGSTDGFVFSHRPISIGEQVCISQSYGPVGNGSSDGYLCFGVTTVDPVDLSVWQNFSYDEIREHDNSPNYWIKSIPQEKLGTPRTVQFSVSQEGAIVYCVEGLGGWSEKSRSEREFVRTLRCGHSSMCAVWTMRSNWCLRTISHRPKWTSKLRPIRNLFVELSRKWTSLRC